MRIYPIFYLLVIYSVSSENVYASFFDRKEEGWFWYQALPIEEDEPINIVSEQDEDTVRPLSAAWFRDNIQTYMDKAIDEPSPENVRAYLYLQRVMMDKSTRFATISEQLVMGDPYLDEVTRRPLAPFASQALDKQAGNTRDEVLESIAKQAGLFFFFRSDCTFCHAQAPILEQFATHYQFTVLPISVDGYPLSTGHFPQYHIDSGQASSLNVTTVPALFLITPDNTIHPISQGTLSATELQQRIVMAALQADLIDINTFERTLPIQPQHSLAELTLPHDTNILSDSRRLVEFLRKQGNETK